MRGMPRDRATRDLLAAASYLRALKSVNASSVGTLGWCMGGGLALEHAMADPKLKAIVVNYGSMPTEPAQIKKISAPVLGVFGGQDRGIPVESVKKFEQEMKQQGKKVDVHVYAEAGHAFQNPNNKAGYRAGDASDSWQITLNFLKQNLR
jgi:carboxymethylenebutenolidase